MVMRRRRLLAAAVGTSLLWGWPPRASAQAGKKRVAIVTPRPDDWDPAREKAFKAEVAAAFAPHGFRDGENLEIAWFEFPEGVEWSRAMPEAARRAVAFRPDCIRVTFQPLLPHVLRESGSIPVVAVVDDPIASGLAKTLNRPGGNVTGIHTGEREVNAKRVQLLKALAPQAKCVAWIAYLPHEFRYVAFERAVTEAGLRARKLIIPSAGRGKIDITLEAFRRELAKLRPEGCTALHLHSSVEPIVDALAAAALEHRLAVSNWDLAHWKKEGLLFVYDSRTRSFGNDLTKRTTAQVARILKGERPGDIAFEGPLGYYLFVNARTASRIGVTLPPEVLLQADEVER